VNPLFLTFDEVVEIHRDQLDRYGGQAGIRDEGQLRSVCAQPEATFGGEYLHEDLFEMAAAYAFHIARGSAFSTATSARV
jgi:death-on-curing protein